MTKVALVKPLFFLNCLGLDPQRNNKIAMWQRICSSVFLFAIITLAFAEILFNFKGFKTFTRSVEALFPQYQLITKFICVWLKSDEIKEILKFTPKFWSLNRHGPEFEQKVKPIHTKLNKFFNLYLGLLAITTIPYLWQIYNGTPIVISYLENDDPPRWYQNCVTILQLGTFFVTMNIFYGFDFLFFFLSAHGLSELKLVKYSFRLIQRESRGLQQNKLIRTIEHHKQVLDYFNKINNAFSIALLQQHISALFCICSGLILMSEEGLPPDADRGIKYFNYILTFILQIWSFSFAGNLIIDWSLEIPNEVFYSIYGSGVNRNRWINLMILQRSQIPAAISLGGFGNLDLESFSLVLKNSMSVFTFVNAMKEDANNRNSI